MRISELFELKVARSRGSEDYASGSVPLVTNTALNNGVTTYVTPLEGDRVYDGHSICVSGLGFATLQLDRFLPKGNGGDSATILIPKTEMPVEALVYYTAVFNLLHNWRFSFGRKCSKQRVQALELPDYSAYSGNFGQDFKAYIATFKEKIAENEALI